MSTMTRVADFCSVISFLKCEQVPWYRAFSKLGGEWQSNECSYKRLRGVETPNKLVTKRAKAPVSVVTLAVVEISIMFIFRFFSYKWLLESTLDISHLSMVLLIFSHLQGVTFVLSINLSWYIYQSIQIQILSMLPWCEKKVFVKQI